MSTTLTGDIHERIDQAAHRAVEIRHDLHAHPETRYKERRTAQTVARELADLGIEHAVGLGAKAQGDEGTAVVAHLPATTDTPGPCLALRADMDALPIQEASDLPYRSTHDGVMHACGHDGHTAILLATARVLAETEHRPNPVTLVFQPAEEGGAGAEKLIRDGLLTGIVGPAPEFFYGLHGWPEAELGTVTTRPGALLASTDLVSVTVRGRQAHAAFPHKASDPVLSASAIITGAQHIVSRRTSPTDAVVVSFTNFHAGTAVNVIPEAAMIRATVRCLANETRAETKERLIAHIEHTALAHGCVAEIDWDPGYPVTLNDPGETRRVLETAQNARRANKSEVLAEPTLGGEDFSFYAQKVPSCFFCLGLNPDPATPYAGLHTPAFDFNDDAVPLGIEMMCRLALDQR